MKSSTSSSGHHESHLNNCNYYIKIGLVPAKPSCRTTFGTTLSKSDEMGSVLSLGEAKKSPCPSQLILSDKNVKGILINIFGGIMRCDVIAQGVIEAAKETNLKVPLVVRLAGTNFKEGKNMLDKSGLKILSATDLNDAAKKIVEAIK